MIKVEDVGLSYGDKEVLRNINLKIEEGEFVCILGKSGCGKSTLLRLISGLLNPTRGRILIDEEEHLRPNLDIGMVFQDYSLFPWMTTGKNIVMALEQKFKDKSKDEIIEKTRYFIDKVGLEADTYDKYPNELSGGMRQRCAICRSFALDPNILLMDEPFGALDAITRNRLQDMTASMWLGDGEDRKTIIFVTHDVDEAIKLGTSIYLLGTNKGEILYKYENIGEKDHHEIRNKLIDLMNEDIIKQGSVGCE